MLLCCFLIRALIDVTSLGTFFTCKLSVKSLGPLLKYGREAKDPEIRFCIDRVLPVQRATPSRAMSLFSILELQIRYLTVKSN